MGIPHLPVLLLCAPFTPEPATEIPSGCWWRHRGPKPHRKTTLQMARQSVAQTLEKMSSLTRRGSHVPPTWDSRHTLEEPGSTYSLAFPRMSPSLIIPYNTFLSAPATESGFCPIGEPWQAPDWCWEGWQADLRDRKLTPTNSGTPKLHPSVTQIIAKKCVLSPMYASLRNAFQCTLYKRKQHFLASPDLVSGSGIFKGTK